MYKYIYKMIDLRTFILCVQNIASEEESYRRKCNLDVWELKHFPEPLCTNMRT